MRVFLPALLACLIVTSTATANDWTERRVLNMAHGGGLREAPGNTMFAYERALANGSDVLEIDVNITNDGHMVVIHDTTVDRTTNGTGRVNDLTLAEIKQLDAADTWPEYKGIALGQKEPPEGFTPNDFKVPTLREVLQRYPKTLINIEIKGDGPDLATQGFLADVQAGRPTILDAADATAALLAEFERFGDTIVVSFSEAALTHFEAAADPRIDTATALATTAAFYTASTGPLPGLPLPGKEALQPPTFFQGIEVPTADFVRDAHANGLVVQVWLEKPEEENAATYGKLVDAGVDGIMTDYPTRLETFLAERGVTWKPKADRQKKGKSSKKVTRKRVRAQAR